MKNILVLGGTGAMGAHISQILADRGDKVSVTTRSPRQSLPNIAYIQGNAKEDSFLAPLLACRWDAIVDFMVYSTRIFERRAPKFLAATDQYFFLSSARVYAESDCPISEESPRLLDSSDDARFLATDEYSLAKARQENVLRQSGSKNWTIIRPYITYSEQRLQLGILEKEGWLYRALKGRTIVFSEDIASKLTTLTYGLDVAAAMATLIGAPHALGETFQITRQDSVTWREVLSMYLDVLEKHLGKRPKVLLLDLDDFSHCKPAKYQIRYDRLFNRVFDSSKIAEFVDLQNFRSLEQGLTHCLKEFLEKPEFLAIDWRSEAVKDRFSGEFASLKEIIHWKQKIKYLLYRFLKK
ncbi:NAD(P)H-binding protein [Marinobacter nauticus]|uniref:NAD(P)H-binding protein n=1 Tax=Marinobacter nauticus TaxID=2743 RepID=UPI001C996A95|nr:NAD(P)H-binding protein [Marinobacter nauticus]MBY5937706.1 NAD(P)H-binding protein [Marinobacter nauticus]MBY5954934.1 NAD(P)H-binding protein [Marinobacter nauticus]MBY6008727.1 NAD(P)H-binding protein [Marinobacter nauticus]